MNQGISLTSTQLGMLVHHWRAGRHSGVDLEQIVVDLDEAIDPEAMRRAWHAVVQRHAALRTRFLAPAQGDPVQVVEATVDLPFDVVDWRHRSGSEQARELAALMTAWRREGFDLGKAPLMRVALAQVGEAAWRMVWMVHHAVCDGRSFPVVLTQVLAWHDDLPGARSTPALPPGGDFEKHVRATADAAITRAVEAEAFWRQRLEGLAATPLPLRSIEPVESTAAAFVEHGEIDLHLEPTTSQALHRAAGAHGLGLSTIVQGAWAITLSRFTGEDDVVFGAVRGNRGPAGDKASHAMVGCLINTLPVRVTVDGAAPTHTWLAEQRRREREVRPFESSALMDVQRWSGVMAQRLEHGHIGLFDSVLIYDHASLDAQMRQAPWAADPAAAVTAHARRRFRLVERTPYPVTLYAWADTPMHLRLAFDKARVGEPLARRLLGGVVRVLEGIAADPTAPIDTLDILERDDAAKLRQWNDTRDAHEACDASHASGARSVEGARGTHTASHSASHTALHTASHTAALDIARAFAAQVRRTPDATAVICGDSTLTYDALNRRANRLAFHLMGLGVGPEAPVAVLLSRSTDLVVAILAITKAGGAWLPLDPHYPRERLAYQLDDAKARVLITQRAHAALLDVDGGNTTVVRIDNNAATFDGRPDHDPAVSIDPARLAYLIYTSGSTGRPKGVMVEQRQVGAFFAAMDQRIPRAAHGGQDTWLAVTSLAFDISILELVWTLTRGFEVVIHDESFGAPPGSRARAHDDKPVAFSLMYFASAASAGVDPYRLLIEGAKFADTHGFEAVWTPERHFHDFGGLYPNPAQTSAMLAAVTSRVHLRAGSVVAALHHPARIAEEWAVADNLSNGRVGVSFASGWQPRDFVLAPHAFGTTRQTMLDTIEQVRKLWRGDALALPGPKGQVHEVRTLPRPKQRELPMWITAAGAPQTFADAGRLGAGVLTHLLGQTVDEVGQKIAAYREAWRAAGHLGNGHVTLMLHTFVGDDTIAVRETVRQPMVDYLGSSLGLVKGFAAQWSAFKKGAGNASAESIDIDTLADDERRGLLDYAFERYFETSGLFGDEERALDMVDRMKGIGVDEIACLIDFGVDTDTTLAHLRHLARVHERAQPIVAAAEPGLAAPMQRHGVTHLQCTPSLASALVLDEAFAARLPRLRALLLGGEALPPSLAATLLDAGVPTLVNMYGPTETTIWSTTHRVTRDDAKAETVPIGHAIANTTLHVVDRRGRLVPPGVAGELWIGGAGVVRGYHARPELTAERFVPDPWSTSMDGPPARAYRTGDLVRRRDDGSIEYLGRIDHQVKIRGHRIELGEIEAALAMQAGVREAVVVARTDTPGEPRLVAYVVPTSGDIGSIDGQALRHALRSTLPEAMVPAHVVALTSLPQTPNRKIDRKALPAPESLVSPTSSNGAMDPDGALPSFEATGADAAAMRSAIQAPTPGNPPSDLESRIGTLWQEVLSRRAVGLDDNFFDLGGHSLLAVKAHRRMLQDLPEATTANLAITDLFRYPTVRALARRLGDGAKGEPRAAQAGTDRASQRRGALAARRVGHRTD